MPSSFTTNFAIEKPATGEQSGSWGTTTNHNFDIFDRLAGYKSVTVSGTTHTLTVRPSSPSSGSSNASDGMYRVIEFKDSGSDLATTVYVSTSEGSAYNDDFQPLDLVPVEFKKDEMQFELKL